jgi:hypothetical protein
VLAGVAPGLSLGPQGLLLAVAANPLESGRILAILGASPGGGGLGPFGGYLVGRFGSSGAMALLAGALALWIVGPLLLARRSLSRRDV